KSLAMPPFPSVLLKEDIPDEPVREAIPDMPEAFAKSQKKNVPIFKEEHDVGSGVEFEAEKEEDKEKLVEENLNVDEDEEDKNKAVKEAEHEEQAAGSEERPVRQGQDAEITTVLPVKQLVDEVRVVGEVIPPDAGLAMTDKDTDVGEIASDIAPPRRKKRTKRGKVVKQASTD
ncbi:hypothetical protein A2U01_0032939, partial [Trifolium medium]|nr:hypothetical protein [Trifolium medium]